MRRWVLLGLTVLLLTLNARAEECFLFQVCLNSPQDRAKAVSSGLVPYTLMHSSLIAEGTKEAAASSGLKVNLLLRSPVKGAFYLVIPPFGKTLAAVRVQVARHSELLAEDTDAFFVRADPKEAESLLPAQFHIVRVWMSPIDLGLSLSLVPPRVATYNPVIQWIIDQITVGEISGMLRDLSGERPVMVRGRQDTIRTRDAFTVKNSSAIWYFYEQASSYAGLDSVAFHPYSWYGGSDSNVVATKIGRLWPRQQYLMGGHIDCTSEQLQFLAPGADDNGSGAIAALIAAKVMRQIPFKRTVKLMAFNSEEHDYGSGRYASEARLRGDSILGMLNGDMIGTNYTLQDSVLAYHNGQLGSILLTYHFQAIDTTYHLGLKVSSISNAGIGSDQYPFWQNGFAAAAIFENDFSHYYHTSNDRITAMDTVYWTKVVKCMVATLCDLAEPDTFFIGVEEPSTPQVSNSTRPLTVSPNPIITFATLPGHLSERFSLYDVSGRRVGTYKGDRIGEGLPAGVYFLRASGDGTKPLRIVKLR